MFAYAYRVFAVFLSLLLFYSSAAAGVHAAAKETESAVRWLIQRNAPPYTDRPLPVRVPEGGFKRDPKYRGGVWNDETLARLQRARDTWNGDSLSHARVSLNPQVGGGGGGSGSGGGEPFPWENYISMPSEAGKSVIVNTNTGNMLSTEPIVSWPSRGLDVEIVLYHNAIDGSFGPFGFGWTTNYDIEITEDPLRNVIVRYGDGTTVPYTYTGEDNSIWSYVAPAGVHEIVYKAEIPGVYRIKPKDGTTYTLAFVSQDVNGSKTYKLTSIEDRAGNTIVIGLSGKRITSVTCPTGRIAQFNSGGSMVDSIVAPDGRQWNFTYEGFAGTTVLKRITFPIFGSTYNNKEFTYEQGGPSYSSYVLITKVRDFAGNEWNYDYNDPLTGTGLLVTSPLGFVTKYMFTSGSCIVSLPEGQERTDNYTSGRLSSIQDGADYTVHFAHDSANNVTSYTDERGKVWTFAYDTKGNVLTETDPLGHQWSYTYNTHNELLTAEDPDQQKYTLTWDFEGNLLTVADPLNRVVMTNTYDANGLLLTSKNAMNETTSIGYDLDADVNLITDPTGRWVSILSDNVGRPLEVSNHFGHVTQIAYDTSFRPKRIVHPDSNYAEVSYDSNGNVVTATNERGKIWQFFYDADNRLTSTRNPLGFEEVYGYNQNGWVTTVRNGRFHTRTYQYTDRGEVYTLSMPDGTFEQWAYNGTGHVTSYDNFTIIGDKVEFVYDDAGRTTTIDYPTDVDTAFTYDTADRLKTMVDGTGTTTWHYNVASEVTSIVSPQGTVHYTYEPSGRRATMRPAWLTNPYTYDYDSAGRLTTFGTPWNETVSFAYDEIGRESVRTFTGGHYEERTYDSRDRLTSVILKDSLNAVLRSQSYTYQANSNVLTHTLGTITTTYGYDDADQLTSESDTGGYSASYTYDGNGNRATRTLNGVLETYAYDAGDKLTSVTWSGGFKNFYYDGAGNTKRIETPSGDTLFSYDEEGRLEQITYPSASTNSFTYNGFRARRTKTDSTGTRNYVRDGQGAASEIVSDGQAFHFLGGLGDHRGTSTFWHHGGLKNVDGRTDTAGGLLATKSYDAFGNQKGSWGWMPSAEKYGGKFGYQSDPDSGLMMLGHRYYDPDLGRFVTKDPARHGDNWFVYCQGNPASHEDHTGLCSCMKGGGGALSAEEAAALAARSAARNPITQFSNWLNRILARLGWRAAPVVTATGTATTAGGPRAAFQTAGQNASQRAAQYGNFIHKVFQDAYTRQPNSTWEKEVGVPGGRIDLLDRVNRVIIEIKPNNLSAIWRGIRQLERYEKALGGSWEKRLITYERPTWWDLPRLRGPNLL